MISCTLGSTTTNGAAKINPDWQGYKGYIYAPSYVYRYSDERNRKWEEAIIKLANDYLDPATGHVRLLDQENTHLFVNADMVRTAGKHLWSSHIIWKMLSDHTTLFL